MSDTQINDYTLTKECESLAAEIFAEILETMESDEQPDFYRDEMLDRAHEAADMHQWVIYTHYALLICAHCNTDNGEELVDEVGPPKPFTLAAAASLVAYGEMRARIDEELTRLCDEWEAPETAEEATA